MGTWKNPLYQQPKVFSKWRYARVRDENEGQLRRKIRLFDLTSSGVGMILGAGIYALIGNAAGAAGNSVWISFLVGALISSFRGFSYAELPSMIPKAAAEYSYAREAFEGDLAPFLIGWIIIFTEVVCALLLQG